MLIDDRILKMSAWLIGTLTLILNAVIQVRSLYTMRFARTSSALTDKVLIALISFGDWLDGSYLLVIAVIDVYFGSSFCSKQFDWLLSSSCSLLGVVSTVGSQISLFSMTILSITRFTNISKGLSIPGSVNKKSYILVASIIFFVAGLSITVAVVPMIPHFEDTFVNALYFSNINFLRGFVAKQSLKPTLESYYGRIRLGVSNLSWNSVRSLLDGMFTNTYGGVSHKILGFYGNDPVCLFKFFVSSDEPQSAYSWSLLTINFVSFGVISISYLVVFVITSTSSSSLSQGASGDLIRNRNNRLQRKISVIILTDFLCWVPFIILCFLHTIRKIDASSWYALLSILILPINSVINPLLYDDTVGRIFESVSRIIRTEVMQWRAQDQENNREPGHVVSHTLPDVGSKQGHTSPPILHDVAREPGHTSPPILPDVAREPGHIELPILVLPDAAREPGHTTPPILPDAAREPGHTAPPILPDAAREPGHTSPPILPDAAREPGHTAPPILPDAAREPGHTAPPILPDAAREPGHTAPPIPPDAAREPGHTAPPILPNAAREPGHTSPAILPDAAREPGHTAPPILPDVAREPGHIELPIIVLPDAAREPGHTAPPILPDVAREPGHIELPIIVLPDAAREPGHTSPPILL